MRAEHQGVVSLEGLTFSGVTGSTALKTFSLPLCYPNRGSEKRASYATEGIDKTTSRWLEWRSRGSRIAFLFSLYLIPTFCEFLKIRRTKEEVDLMNGVIKTEVVVWVRPTKIINQLI